MTDLPTTLRAQRTRYLNTFRRGDVESLDRLLARAMDVGYHEGTTDAWFDVRDNDPCRKKEGPKCHSPGCLLNVQVKPE